MQEPEELRTIVRKTLETGGFTVVDDGKSQLECGEGAYDSDQQSWD